MKKNISIHHLHPRSRGGPDELWNRKEVEISIHSAWHTMFSNMRPEEVLQIIHLWFDENNELLNKDKIGMRISICWKIVFGEANLKEVKEIIENEWMFDPDITPEKYKLHGFKYKKRNETQWFNRDRHSVYSQAKRNRFMFLKSEWHSYWGARNNI